ncbi:MAG: hypothetical protein AB1896_21335 [Thermodesulfobacteriota bacterium]
MFHRTIKLLTPLILLVLVLAVPFSRAAEGSAPPAQEDEEAAPDYDPLYPPVAFVPSVEYDFGTIGSTGMITHDFLVRNDGVGELVIKEVSPG